jgi:hypothetical protein
MRRACQVWPKAQDNTLPSRFPDPLGRAALEWRRGTERASEGAPGPKRRTRGTPGRNNPTSYPIEL